MSARYFCSLFLLFPMGQAMAENPMQKCPSSPNCVSSVSGEDEKHKIEPFKFKETLEATKQALQKAIESSERSRITEQKEDYWKCEFKSKLWGFVDDVEFYFDKAEKMIHVRSASRTGYSDMGVNRKRIEALRSTY